MLTTWNWQIWTEDQEVADAIERMNAWTDKRAMSNAWIKWWGLVLTSWSKKLFAKWTVEKVLCEKYWLKIWLLSDMAHWKQKDVTAEDQRLLREICSMNGWVLRDSSKWPHELNQPTVDQEEMARLHAENEKLKKELEEKNTSDMTTPVPDVTTPVTPEPTVLDPNPATDDANAQSDWNEWTWEDSENITTWQPTDWNIAWGDDQWSTWSDKPVESNDDSSDDEWSMENIWTTSTTDNQGTQD